MTTLSIYLLGVSKKVLLNRSLVNHFSKNASHLAIVASRYNSVVLAVASKSEIANTTSPSS